ncbi:MAG: hypothetical protein KatS3mg115_2189 [Candidatus Poribacteria bacterium]|nr:MAG: hypothetical protein KatS3mg115_2189 [Candidatus Poribacteria bacterium]
MDKERVRRLARGYFEELANTGDPTVADRLLAEDYVQHNPDSPTRRTVGREAFKERLQMYRQAFPDLTWTIEEILVEGDRAAVRWSAVGTHRGPLQGVPPTGRRVRMSGITIHRVAGGRIVESWVCWDTINTLLTIGAVRLTGKGP